MALGAANVDAEEAHAHVIGQPIEIADALLVKTGCALGGIIVIAPGQNHITEDAVPRAVFGSGILQILFHAVIVAGIEQPKHLGNLLALETVGIQQTVHQLRLLVRLRGFHIRAHLVGSWRAAG